MRIQTDAATTKTASQGTAAKTTSTTGSTDFQAIYSSKVQELWQNFAETGLTAAEQELKKAGGEDAVRLKKEIEKRRKESQSSQTVQTETIHKYMPDGSLLTITTKNGKVVEEGPSREIFDHPKDDYTKALLAAAFDIKVAHRAALAT